MKSLFEKQPSNQKPISHKDQIEDLLGEIDHDNKELLDAANRQNAQIKDSIELIKNMNQKTERKIEQVKDLRDQADIEGSRSVWNCAIF